MVPRERFVKALQRGEPDRVPLFAIGVNGVLLEKLFNRPVFQRNPQAYLEACAKGRIEEVHLKIAEDQIELAEKFDLDAVRDANQIGAWYLDPRWEYLPKNSHVVKKSDSLWEIDGSALRYVQEINSLFKPTPYVPVDPDRARDFLKSHMNDLDIPDQETVALRRVAKRVKGKRFIIGVIQGTFILEPFSSHMLVWLHSNPDLVKLWLEYYLRINTERAKVKIDAGAEAIIENDDYGTTAGPMIAPKYFKELVVPNLRSLSDTVHKKGAFFIKHTDGNINLLLEDIVSTGIDALHPLERQAGMDMAKVKRAYGDRICVIGNVHSALGGDKGTDHVVKETIDCIRATAPGGGYIMTTSNVITPDAKEENFRAWIETTRKYGNYPIN